MAAARLTSNVRLPWDHITALSANFQHLLSIFPTKLEFAFAYGSSVYKQDGYKSTKGNMVDLIFVVDDPVSFHSDNLHMNPKHYSALKYCGPSTLAAIQDHWGARIYFNTLVPCDLGLLKYGVISTASLITDLLDWEWLYTSGRLHKPVVPLILPQNSTLRSALQLNLQNALHTALLLLPEIFTEESLYLTLTGLSYAGDFRMIVGEDRNKVSNIVRPQQQNFRELYSPLFPLFGQWADLTTSGRCVQDASPPARLFHLNLLPKKLQQIVVHGWNRDGRWQDVEDILRAAAHDTECPELIKDALRKIVRSSSWTQSLKGILTAGVTKSVRYSSAKLGKMWKSLKK
nr:EOG090X06VP [Cyclestheria hislopi]